MDIYKQLPKDLAYIVCDYLKDKKNYEIVLDEMRDRFCESISWICMDYHFPLFLDYREVLNLVITNKNRKIYSEFLTSVVSHEEYLLPFPNTEGLKSRGR